MPRSTSRPAPASPASADCACMLRLYVSPAAPSSARAVVNTRAFCEAHLAGRYELEILNIGDHIAEAASDEIIAAPTLLRVWPLPVRRFIGDMSNPGRLQEGLGLPAAVSRPHE